MHAFFRPVAIVFVWCCTAAAIAGDEQLDPKTYISPNGRFTLSVNPSRPSGAGGAAYVVMHDRKPAWSGEKDFTLWDAAITDSGVVCGYSYEDGLSGYDFDFRTPNHAMNVLILDAGGNLLLKDPRSRDWPQNVNIDPTPPPSPTADGILAHAQSDMFLLRLDGGFGVDDESWARYQISTGTKLADITPDQPAHGQHGFHRAHNCAFVPGTPLILMQWFTWDIPADGVRPNKTTQAARLSLLNTEGKEVWRFDVPGEYDNLGNDWSDYWDLVRPGIKQSGVTEKSFWFHSYSLKAKLQFVIRDDPASPSGWKVVESARTPAGPPAAPDAATSIERITRAPLGSIHLQDAPDAVQSSPLHDIYSFAMNDTGTIAIVRANPAALVLMDQTGKVLTERPLADVGVKNVGYVTALPNSRWLVSDDGLGDETPAAWVFDPSDVQKPFTKADALKTGALRESVGLPDGGFAAITGSDWPGAHTLTAFDATGKVRWEAETGCMPQGLAVTTNGTIAVLCGQANTIQRFSLTGESIQVIRLEQSLGRKPNYVAGLAPGNDGGFILMDFGGTPSVYVLDKDGKPVQSMTPAYEDGREFRVVGTPCASADGRLWSAARDGVMRLGASGRADFTLGNASANGTRSLNGLNALCVTSNAMYAVNSENGALHVFNTDGTPVRVMRQHPEDFTVEEGFGSIAPLADSTVFYYPSRSYDSAGFVQFSPQGERVARVPTVLGEVSEEWYGIPESRSRWAVGYQTIAILDEKGTITKRINRRPDNAWFGKLSDAAIAPDGSIAVINGPAHWGSRGPAHVCIYSKTGEPRSTVLLPEDTVMWRLAFNGRLVAATISSEVYLIPLDGGKVRMFDLPQDPEREPYWYLHTSPDGKELWALRAGTTDLIRFAFD